MDTLLKLGNGSLIRSLLILPFAVNGLILLLRGAIANLDSLAEKHPKAKDWQASAYFAILILSYLALVYAIKQLL